jgi:hypothetical protein
MRLRRKSVKYLMGFIMLVVVFFGCRKRTDNIPPVVQISSPVYMAGFNVFDFVSVAASVSDENRLVAITVDLQDENFSSIVPIIAISPTSKEATVSESFYLEDIHLESGLYYIKVWAYDGVNEKSAYREIHVTGAPLEMNNMFVVSSSVAGEQEWSSFTTGSIVPFHTFQSEYGGAAVNSYHQYLHTVGAESDGLVAYHPGFVDTLWFKDNPGNPPLPYYGKIQEGSDGLIYVTTTTGKVLSYGQSGTIGSEVNSPNDHAPDDFFLWNGKIVVEQRHLSSASHVMGVYHPGSGVLDQSISFGNDIVSWEIRNDDELFVFSNDPGNQAHMHIYGYSGNYFWEPHGMPAGRVYDSYRKNSNEVIISHELGLYHYTYSSNSLIQIESGHSFTKLLFDKVSNVLYCVESNNLFTYDLSGIQLAQLVHSDAIEEVLLLYNK